MPAGTTPTSNEVGPVETHLRTSVDRELALPKSTTCRQPSARGDVGCSTATSARAVRYVVADLNGGDPLRRVAEGRSILTMAGSTSAAARRLRVPITYLRWPRLRRASLRSVGIDDPHVASDGTPRSCTRTCRTLLTTGITQVDAASL